MSFYLSKTAGFDGALTHFREVIIGSISIGLTSIKKLADTPPELIARRTNSSLEFMGIAGEKFLKDSLKSGDFFQRNKNPGSVRLMLMDPFSDDIARLSRDRSQQLEYRRKIVQTIIELSELRTEGFEFTVRLYPKVPPLRLLISDSSITALSVYAPDTNGWKNAQLVFNTKDCPDSLAPYFSELFDDLWERGLNFNLDQRALALKALLHDTTDVTKIDLGMVHGRFQPFHHEHLEYVLHGISRSKKCIIAITQPNIKQIAECDMLPHRGTPEGNPYSFDERRDMIKLSLENLGISPDAYVIEPFDVDHAKISIDSLVASHGKPVQFIKIFSEWELHKKQLFENAGLEIVVVRGHASQITRKNVTGTLVRELVHSDRNWRDFVPAGTHAVLSRVLQDKLRM
jgi:nicotinamide mononucleotide adenylyltransferase